MSPRISVLTTVYDPRRDHLEACLASVRAQRFDEFEHVLIDDASTQPHVADLLAAAAGSDPRVRVVRRSQHGGIAAAGNDALALAEGELVALLDHDDVLAPEALAEMSAAVTDDVDVAYSDHDMIRSDGRFVTPAYKPNFSPERLRSQNYIDHLLVARRGLVDQVGGFGDGLGGAARHDLLLRLTERARNVAHVPHVLYHCRQPPSSVTTGFGDEPSGSDAGVRAVADHCDRVGIAATVDVTDHAGCYRVRRRLSDHPLVSVVIPTRGTSGRVWGATRCYVTEAVRSLVERSTYQAFEFVVVYDTETPDSVLTHLRHIAGDALTLVAFDGEFNFSAKINLGVMRASGDLLLLLNDDTELIAPDSVETLVGHLQMADVAMAGAKLLFSDGTLQHGGHLYNHDIGHACFGWAGESPGPRPLLPLAVERECSGVTAAAALVRRSAFEDVGGLATELPLNYNDVDFSLKLRAAGHRIVWSPWASWYHFESRTRQSGLRPGERQFIDQRWHAEINNDPYYNPNLVPDRHDWLERPFRSGAPDVDTRPNVAQRAAARARSLLRPAGVNVIGYFDAASGLGERARQLTTVLRATGIEVSEWNVDRTDSPSLSGARPAPAHQTQFDTTIAVVTAPQLPGLVETHGRLLAATTKLIGYWFWELAEVPDDHRRAIELVDEIWAPTRFVGEAYRAATDKPVRLAPLPIGEPVVDPHAAGEFGFPSGAFTFLVSFDHLSVMERKNPIGAIEAFRRAFPSGDEPVSLLVKSINGAHKPDACERLAEAASTEQRVTIRDEYVPHARLTALIAAADVMVSLHRSEGLGLHLAEAMWLGTPVLATRYSGNLDLMDDSCAALVDATMQPVRHGDGAYPDHARWAEPDLDQAAAMMRRMFEDREWGTTLAGLARERIEAQPSRSEAGRGLVRLLSARRLFRSA